MGMFIILIGMSCAVRITVCCESKFQVDLGAIHNLNPRSVCLYDKHLYYCHVTELLEPARVTELPYCTGVRWPMWIGGKRVEDGSWRWQDGSKVMDFLWSQGQPRYYAQPLIPHGTCMILDGYQRYYGASLPCHLRRRFVCQRRI